MNFLHASDLETLPGYGPLSGPFEGVWDPLSLSATATLGDVRRWRESEITHGRVAMVRPFYQWTEGSLKFK
jgi:hypothetical protein